MEIGIISFTGRGEETAARIEACLTAGGDRCGRTAWKRGMALGEWTRAQFQQADGLVFVGAAGIAVRAVAPFLRDKMTDPAVVAADEAGRFAIPLVSGHVGGANRLAVRIAAALGGTPVITTATDVNGLFAVDVFAAENGLAITDRELAKRVSAKLLAGEPVGWHSDWGRFPRPEGFTDGPAETAVRITVAAEAEPGCLRLVPKAVTMGVGCRRGTPYEALDAAAARMLARCGVSPLAVERLATVEVKRDEEGLIRLARERGWEFSCYSAEELEAVPGNFEESEFVRRTVGTGNVCGRAAALGGRRLIAGKTVFSGITLALALREREEKGERPGMRAEEE